VIGNIRRDGGTPSAESIATQLSGMSTGGRASALLALQQTHGNRYVQRVIAGIQAKLKVGQPGDIYEQEADRVADAVMRMPELGVQRQVEPEEEEEEELLQTKPLAEQITPLIQRQSEVEEEPFMMKPLVQRQADGSFRASHSLERRLTASQRGSSPLPAEVRSFMEPRFGVDFRGVRVHTESDAAQMNRELNAHAFTHGQDIYFGTGKYSHTTVEGKRLLAHELTHVLQQTAILQRQRRYAGSRVRHRIQRDGGGTTLDEPRSEVTPLDITGHYEAEDTSGFLTTVQLNQAGRHFEGWYQRRVPDASGPRSTLRQLRIRGDVQYAYSNRIVATYTFVGSTQGGERSVSFNMRGNNMEMAMESTGGDIYFRRLSTSSRVPTEAVRGAAVEHQSVLEASINAPLHSRDEQRLAAMCVLLRQRIVEYLQVSRFGGSGGTDSERVCFASGIDYCVNQIFPRFAPQQEPLVRRRMQEILATAMYGAGRVTRPYWDWLQIVRAQNPDQTQDLERYLGLRQVGSEGNHRYRWRYSIGTTESREGLGTQPRGRGQAGRTRGSTILGGSILLGTLTIEKLEPERWTQFYTMGMVQVSAGVSRGIVHDATTRWTVFTTPFAWEGGNFEGPIAMARATAAATARTGGGQGVGSGAGSGFLTFYGDGSNAPITVDASGLITIMGSYIGAELSVSGGYIAGGEDEVVRHCQPPEAIREQVHYRPQGVAHFALDDPSLTDEGRRAIRRFCATHLTSLQNPSSSLRVEGFTDPLGTPQRNYELSRLRAVNTLQAIRDIMGNRLGIPQGQQEAEGLGETASYSGIIAEQRAAGQEIPSNENIGEYVAPHWRKAEVSIGGQVLLTLY
jgi:outer membrane protein OmpA-like peptidoglycan-associated protein